jgi:hypothetical protein
MIKKLFLVFIAIYALQINAQQGTASPYSFYGIGSLKFKGTTENLSMGGISVYSDSVHINLRNPAFYADKNLKAFPFNGESSPVKFTVGGSATSLKLKSNTDSESTSISTFDYFALSVPIGKFGFGFGLLPFTSVGYKLEDIDDQGITTNRYSGEGGLNKVFAGFGYEINDNLRAGIDFSYNFGNINNTAIEFVYDDDGNLVQFQSREKNESELTGITLNFGLNYKTVLKNNLELTLSATYSPESSISSTNTRTFSIIVINSLTGQEIPINTIDADLESLGLDKTDLTLPSRLSFGGGIGNPTEWFVGGEYVYMNTSVFSNPIVSISNSTFENSSSFAVGGFFIPDHDAFKGYFKRIVYRAGARYKNTGLILNNESIDEFGISFGVGLPLGSVFSNNLNFGFEYGQRGTTNQNLIQEDFFNVSISLTLNDRWFKKRKYN